MNFQRAAFETTVNGLPYMVVALKLNDGRKVVSTHVQRNGKWAALNGYNHRHAVATAEGNVADQIREFYGAAR